MAGRLLVGELAKDDVSASHRLIDEKPDLVGWILEIIVHRDDVVAGCLPEACEVRVVLT